MAVVNPTRIGQPGEITRSGYATLVASTDGVLSDVLAIANFKSGDIRLIDGTSNTVSFLAGSSPTTVATTIAGANTIASVAPAGGFFAIPQQVMNHAYIKVVHASATSVEVVLKNR